MRATAAVLTVLVLVTVFYERVVSLRALLVLAVLTILFIPIRRYSLPGSLPFNLEPYRVFVAFIIAAWILALLVDRRVRLRASGLEAPLLCYLGAVVLSMVANPSRVEAVGSYTWKNISFLLSYVFVFYVFVSVLAEREGHRLLCPAARRRRRRARFLRARSSRRRTSMSSTT